MSQFLTIVSIISLLIALGLSGAGLRQEDRILAQRHEKPEDRIGKNKVAWIFTFISVITFIINYYV